MKNYFLLLFITLAALSTPAQTTTTFTLNANDEDATIDNYNPAGNYPNEIECVSRAWTINSVPTVWRSLFKFNLSCIPQNAIVQNAQLSLYYAVQNGFGNQLHESLTSSNESVVQRVTTAWSENTVTWNNQPASTTADELILPQSTYGTQDYLNMDVTAMVQAMISTANNGFLLKLTNETYYANLIFASGDNPDSARHPLLSVTYTVPGITCLALRMNPSNEEATIDNYNPGGNYPNEIETVSRAWTINSTPVLWRSLFKFEFPCSMSGASIQSAYLSLYYAAQNNFGNQLHESLTNSDESVLQRITVPWSANTVTWNNQPATTSVNQVILPQSTSGTQDYTNLDVTAMVQDMAGSGNYGFLIKLTNEVEYANLIFASGNNPDTARHAKLEICYTVPTGLSEISHHETMSIYPVPATHGFTLENKRQSRTLIQILNVMGSVIIPSFTLDPFQSKKVDADLPAGIYFVECESAGFHEIRKLLIQ